MRGRVKLCSAEQKLDSCMVTSRNARVSQDSGRSTASYSIENGLVNGQHCVAQQMKKSGLRDQPGHYYPGGLPRAGSASSEPNYSTEYGPCLAIAPQRRQASRQATGHPSAARSPLLVGLLVGHTGTVAPRPASHRAPCRCGPIKICKYDKMIGATAFFPQALEIATGMCPFGSLSGFPQGRLWNRHQYLWTLRQGRG